MVNTMKKLAILMIKNVDILLSEFTLMIYLLKFCMVARLLTISKLKIEYRIL